MNETPEEKKKRHQGLSCSFCGKSQCEVKKLIAGPMVYICDECIGLCNDIIAEEIDREEAKEGTAQEGMSPEPPKSPIPKIEFWPLPKAPPRFVEFVRGDGEARVVINPRHVVELSQSTTDSEDPVVEIMLTARDYSVEVQGTLDDVREKLTKS